MVELILMKNLGKTSVQWLNSVGIRTSDELRRRGAVSAYEAVRLKGFNTSRMLLYSIAGALLDKYCKDMSLEQKITLRRQADARCKQAPDSNQAVRKNSSRSAIDIQMRITMISTSSREAGR